MIFIHIFASRSLHTMTTYVVTGVTNVYFMVARLIRFVLKGFVQSKVYSNNIK